VESYEKVADTLEELLRRRRAGRKRRAPITLPALGSFVDDADNVKLARVRLEIAGDPLAIKAGRYAERPRYGVGEVTPERMGHIKRGKNWLQTESERFKDGRPTGLQHKRIKSQLEVWFERGVISRPAFLAFQAFQRDYDLSLSAGGTMIAKYGPQVPMGTPELLPVELRAEYQRSRRQAAQAVDPALRPVLAWVAECGRTDVSAEAMALQYWPEISERTAVERFKGLLEAVGAALSRHYNLAERHRWLESLAQVAGEISQLLGAAA
jgi:hypothetical protein